MIYKSLDEYLRYMRDRYQPMGYSNKPKDITLVSCPADPLHSGHISYLRGAKQINPENELIVIVNGDSFLRRKKGYCLLPEYDRATIIDLIECVGTIIIYESDSMDVSECILKLKPDIFANGGDRQMPDSAEALACQEVGCMTIYGVGGWKKNSSSTNYMRNAIKQYRTWQKERLGQYTRPPDPLEMDKDIEWLT